MSPSRGGLRAAAAIAAVCATLAAGGCASGDDDQLPPACLADADAYLSSLLAAPEPVRLEGETPISECLLPDQRGGQLATVGSEMVQAATELNLAARRDPEGPETVQLGYLVGAVERGAEGIHADLVRRLNSAARYSPDGLLPAEFERGLGRGYAAGLESG